jgi:hypothetical protein
LKHKHLQLRFGDADQMSIDLIQELAAKPMLVKQATDTADESQAG